MHKSSENRSPMDYVVDKSFTHIINFSKNLLDTLKHFVSGVYVQQSE